MLRKGIAVLMLLPVALPAAEARAEDPAALRAAVQKAIAVLLKQSPQFVKRGGCNSCHAQFLPAVAQALARARGIPAGADIVQLPPEASEMPSDRVYEMAGVGGGANSMGYLLFAEAALKKPADERIQAIVHFLRASQATDGRWQTVGNRPPLTYDDFTTTALTIYALQAYTPESQRAETDKSVGRSLSWLLEATPQSTVERAFHLAGLGWAKGPRAAIDKAARGLLAEQHPDGGWSQLPAMSSDAYATGLALYALRQNGQVTTSEPYRRGIQYLLQTQASDGSWHVKTRSLPVQPYFDSGFPYGDDQWISAAGTSWAAMALALAVEPVKLSRR